MQTLIFLSLAFLITVFSILLYLKNKTSRVTKLNQGECPTCGEKTREFFDKTTNTKFKQEVIHAKLLKNHGCSGVRDIEYTCSACGLREVHSQ